MATLNKHDEPIADSEIISNRSRYLDKNSLLIYLSHLLSSFGDRVWHFAVGVYIFYLYPCSLMLTGCYGFATCAALFLFGAPVGRWVDNSKRLEAARISIAVQNSAVVMSAALMASAIYYKQEILEIGNGKLEPFLYTLIIAVEVIAELASMANKLVLEKDWIVVLARGDKHKLSCLNATMRTINLSCKIMAPFVVGHLLAYLSYVAVAIFIGTWNLVSAFVEFYLLQIIFSVVPELAEKKGDNKGRTVSLQRCSAKVDTIEGKVEISPGDTEKSAVEQPLVFVPSRQKQKSRSNANIETDNNNENGNVLEIEFHEVLLNDHVEAGDKCHTPENQKKVENNSQLGKLWSGWKVYFMHPVKYAGLGLASLYMTVLCFDNVSIAFLSSQGVGPDIIGNVGAFAALLGILGSLSFPFLRRKLGKNKAGILGFTLETFCLLLCVLSVMAPGSPFAPQSILTIFSTSKQPCDIKNVENKLLSLREHWNMHSNLFLLVAGIAFARYGLWIADLSVTQIFQEKVHESERGVMGGVQGSLNQLMSLVKFCLAILMPYPENFGYLICLSWLFVFLGNIFIMAYVFNDQRKIYPVGNSGPIVSNQEIRRTKSNAKY